MSDQIKHGDILTAINAVMRDLPAVGKDGVNQAQRFNFRGIDGVLNACGPVLRKHGVIAVPRVKQHIKESVPRRGGGFMTHVLIEMEVVWLLAGQPVDAGLTSLVWGEAFDTSDKATAKAHSVALRTAYIQTLALPTQERDPDEDYHEMGDASQMERAQEVNNALQWFHRYESEGNEERLKQAVSAYSQKGDRDLAQAAGQALERLQRTMRHREAQANVAEALDAEVVTAE